MRDTIQLLPNGDARRAIQIEHRANGEVVGGSYINAFGKWSGESRSLASGSHLTLHLTPPTASSYLMTLKVSGRAEAVARAKTLGLEWLAETSENHK